MELMQISLPMIINYIDQIKTNMVCWFILQISDINITEHIEGDETKFALWTGRVPMSDYRIILKAKDLDTKQNWVKKLREFMTERMQFIPKALKDKPAMLFKPSNIKPLQASKAHLLAFPNRCVKYNVLIMVHVMLWCNQVRTVKDLVNDIFLFWKLAVFSVHKVIIIWSTCLIF